MTLELKDLQRGSVKEGIILTTSDELKYVFYRTDGIVKNGKIRIQIAECYGLPSRLEKLIWDNYITENPDKIDITGFIVKKY